MGSQTRGSVVCKPERDWPELAFLHSVLGTWLCLLPWDESKSELSLSFSSCNCLTFCLDTWEIPCAWKSSVSAVSLCWSRSDFLCSNLYPFLCTLSSLFKGEGVLITSWIYFLINFHAFRDINYSYITLFSYVFVQTYHAFSSGFSLSLVSSTLTIMASRLSVTPCYSRPRTHVISKSSWTSDLYA